MKLFCTFPILAVFALLLSAADVTGTWKGEVKIPTGQVFPFVAHLKQEGMKVTGKLDGIDGAPDVPIMNGMAHGDTITFSGVRQIQGQNVKFNYTAKLSGDKLDFKIVQDDGKGAPLDSLTTREK